MLRITEHCPEDILLPRGGMTYTDVLHRDYFSQTTGLTRHVNVLLPQRYDETKTYPVMYILHGIFGDEYSMIGDRVLRNLAQNLAADGDAADMILVFPDMFAKSNPDDKPAFTNESSAIYDNFLHDLTNDLMPFIESNYAAATGRDNTAISGFSMGGREALYIGITRPDLFGYTCAIAPAPGIVPTEDHFMKHDGTLPEERLLTVANREHLPRLFLICAGTNDTTIGHYPRDYHEILCKNGFSEHVYYEIEGAGHDSAAVNSGYYNFFRHTFRT